MDKLPKLTSKIIKSYQNEIARSDSAATAKRKIVSLKKFLDWAKTKGLIDINLEETIITQAKNETKFPAKKALNIRFQNLYKRYRNIPGTSYLNIAILVILSSTLGLGIYNQFFKNATNPFAATSLVRPNRYLSFQGRLTNQFLNPVTAVTSVVFTLYDAASSGTTLWTGTCNVTPDTDGVFSTLLGSDCGSEISSSVFSDNASVWLGVKVAADAEATPRIQIATVAYALNSETLQGYPASSSATINTVPVVNNSGQIVLAVSSPKIQSTTGTFAIEGQAITIQTPSASNGNVTIAPDGTGQLNLTFTGASPGSGTGMVNATDANLTSGSLYYGSVASDASGYNLLQLQSGSTLSNKFVVDSAGNASASGDLTLAGVSSIQTTTFSPLTIGGSTTGNIVLSPSNNIAGGNVSPGVTNVTDLGTASLLFRNIYATTLYQGVNQVCDAGGGVAGCAGANYWRLANNVLSPIQVAYDLTIGGSATGSAFQVYAATGNVASAGVGQFGSTSVSTYSRFGSATTEHSLSSASDLLVNGKLELNDTLFLDGGTIANSAGTGTITFSPTPTTASNALSASNWLIENTANVGQAALMVNQVKGGDIFTASQSGIPVFTVAHLAGTVANGITLTGAATGSGPTITATGSDTNIALSIDSKGTGALNLNNTATGDILLAGGVGATGCTLTNSTGALSCAGNISTTATSGTQGWWQRVAGNLSPINLNDTISATTSAATAMTITQTGAFDAFLVQDAAGDTTPFVIDQSGNVGIGDTTPSYLLDVAGTLNSTGSTTLGTGASSVNVIGSTTTPGTLTLHGATTLDDTFTVSGNNLTSLGGNLTLSGTTITASSLATLTTSSAVAWGGATELTFTADNATIYGSNAASGNLILDGTSNATKTSSYVIIQPNGGNVGIGTSAPTATLEILADVDTPSGNAIEVQAVESANLNDQDADDITFTNATTCWTYGAGWARSGGTALHSALVGTENLSCNLTDGYIDNNQIYRMTFDMGGRTAGTVTPKVGTAAHDAISANGSYDLTFDATANNTDIIFTPDINFNGYIDNVYIYRRAVNTVISDTGRVGIGRATPAYFLDVLAPENGVIARFLSDNTTGCTLATGGTISCTSDVRLKQDIEDTSFGLDTIMNLRPVDFNWKSGASIYKNLGFIAQEVETLIPNLVNVDQDNGYKQLNTTGLIPVLTKAIQEQQIQISTLSTQLADLKINSTGDITLSGNPVSGYTVSTPIGITQKIGAFANLVAANIHAGALITDELLTDKLNAVVATVQKLTTNSLAVKLISPLPDQTDVTVKLGGEATPSGKLAIQNSQGDEVAAIDSSGNATFSGTVNSNQLTVNSEATISGTLFADNIKSKSLDEIQALLTKVQTDQGLLKDAQSWNTNTATNSATLSGLSASDLYITNQAAINSLSISKTLAVGSDLVFSSSVNSEQSTVNSIDTLSAPLRIQSLTMAPVELMAGLVTIDTHGNVTIGGDLNVAGRIHSSGLTLQGTNLQDDKILNLQSQTGILVASVDASGSAEFESVYTPQLIIAGADATTPGAVVNGATTTNSTIGHTIIPAGTNEITIINPKVTDYTLIYVTPTSSTQNNVLYVKSKQKGQFTVGFAIPIDTDVSFNWWIVQVQKW